MSNGLTVFAGLDLPAAPIPKPSEEGFGFASRIQLVSKGKLVDSGQVRPGHYATVAGDTVADIGDKVDVIPLDVLDKALDTSGDSPEVVFGKDNPKFKEIAARSETRDSGCMYGPVFLVVERNTGKIFEIFFNNKSGRSESSKLYDYLPIGKSAAKAAKVDPRPPKPANLASKYVESKKNKSWKWYVPVITPSTATFEKLPANELIVERVTKFREQLKQEEEGGRDR